MRLFKNYKWFWMTLGLWFSLGAFSAWALIFSPFHLEATKLSEFSALVNGVEQENRIFVSPSSLTTGIETLTKEWQEEGWRPVSGNINLLNNLLNTPIDCRAALDQWMQLRLFHNKDRLRLLGILATQDGHTYHWVCEMPSNTLQDPGTNLDGLPFHPPSGASDVATVKVGQTWSIVFTIPTTFDFRSLCLEQGFTVRTLPGNRGEGAHLLQKGTMKMMAVVERHRGQNRVSLMEMKLH